MIELTIDGKRLEVDPGITVLHALQRAGVELPSLCDDARLAPAGACRLCMVQIDGNARPVTSCSTIVRAGMKIETRTEHLEAERHTLLSLLADRYPAEYLAQFPEKPLHRWFERYGVKPGGSAAERDESHPYLSVDMAACIDCYRCVRICEDVQGQFVWQAWNRGDRTQIRPDGAPTLAESSCVGCGACADSCPSGAIVDVPRVKRGEPSTWTNTTCAYCGVGCELSAGVREGRITQIRPVLDDPVGKGHLCVKGRYAFDYVHASDRATEPMIRRDGVWVNVSWDEALAFVARELRRIVDAGGPDSVGVLGSARATNEENYLTQKFARTVLRTNNVDCCARVCHAPTAAAMKQMLGVGAATGSFDDIELARTILVCGANATESHPVVGARIKQAARRGANLIVIDPRAIELTKYARVHLAPRPGTNLPLLNAIAATIVREGWIDEAFVAAHVDGFGEYAAFIASWTPERAAEVCGVDAHAIVEAARLYAREKPALSLHGLGVTEHVQGTDGVMAIVNLALLTGNLNLPGAAVNPLRGQNNVQGSAQMGCDPASLTGGVAIAAARERFERAWSTPLPQTRGLDLMQMMDASREGRLKALWAIGYDVALTNPDTTTTRQAFEGLELVVVQDMFLNETAREFATVFLPACSSFEKDGTFMNAERRISRVRQTIPPIGNSRADWRIICDLAHALHAGDGFSFPSVRDIWDEIRSLWPAVSEMSYDALEPHGLQWAYPGFAARERPELRRIDFVPSAEQVDEAFPFVLVTGRSLYQFNAGTMTGRTANAKLQATDRLDMSAEDAQRLGVRDGSRVCVVSRFGRIDLPARISGAMARGQLFTTFSDPRHRVNLVTGRGRDPVTSTPEYKVTAVRLEVPPHT